MILLVVFGSLFSYMYIAEHADHDCDHEDCAICRSLDFFFENTGKKALSLMVETGSVVLLFFLTQKIFYQTSASFNERKALSHIRMNN